MKERKKLKKVIILVLLVAFCVSSISPVEAATKKVSKKTITVTLDKKHPVKYYILKTASQKSKTNVSIEITKLKGKPTAKKIEWLFYVDDPGDLWEGSMMSDVKSGEFKKGKLSLNNSTLKGAVLLEYNMPDGVSSVTYKVTFSNPDNKKTIKDVTSIKSTDEWEKYYEKISGNK
jgi:hypothetical protein